MLKGAALVLVFAMTIDGHVAAWLFLDGRSGAGRLDGSWGTRRRGDDRDGSAASWSAVVGGS